MNPYVSIFSSTAVTVDGNNSTRKHVNNDTQKVLTTLLNILGQCMCKQGHLLPLAIRVECHTVNGAEMTLDPAELLFIGSMEEPEDRIKADYDMNT